MKAYFSKLRQEGGTLTQFASDADMSYNHLCHVIHGRKKKMSLDTVIKLLIASDGEISIQSLRPDLFPKGSRGKAAAAALRKAVS